MTTLQVLGEYISISGSLEAYNQFRKAFIEQADMAKLRFCKLYNQNQSLDDVIKKVPEQAEESLCPVIDFCVQILIEHDILTIDNVTFRERYSAYQELWGEPYMKVFDRYAEIVLDQKTLDEYRVYRRQSRARWSGGGFGLSGALKGAATAGALNIISGAGHMVFNGVGKIVSTISANSQKSKIFKDPEVYKSISQGIWTSAFSLHIALIDALAQSGKALDAEEGIISKEASRQASAILNNVSLITSTDEKKQVLLQALLLDPYQENWYYIAIQEFGDHDGQLENLAQYFGISVIYQEKQRIIEDYLKTFPLDTEAQALEAQEKLHEKERELHFSGKTEQGEIIRHTVQEFDQDYRTVDGHLFPTREAADEAKKELAQIQTIESATDYKSLLSIESSESKLAELHTQVAISHRQEMHRKLEALELSLRTVMPLLDGVPSIVCKTQNEADSLRIVVQDTYQKYISCGDGIEAEQPLQKFRSSLQFIQLPDALRKQYEEEIHKRLSEIDLELRSAFGRVYPTREDAAYVRQQFDFICSTIDNIRKKPSQTEVDQLRSQISALDVSEDVRDSLSQKLYQKENEKEIRAVNKISNVCAVLLLGIIILSYLFHIAGTAEFAREGISIFGVPLKLTDIRIVEELNFVEGVKNGLSVFGQSIGNMFVDGFLEYIHGFDNGFIWNIVWAILGLFWVIFKQLIVVIPRYLVSLFVTFFQTASIGYYIGYIVGSAIPIVICSNIVDEDEGVPVEQVERFKKVKSKLRRR